MPSESTPLPMREDRTVNLGDRLVQLFVAIATTARCLFGPSFIPINDRVVPQLSNVLRIRKGLGTVAHFRARPGSVQLHACARVSGNHDAAGDLRRV